VSEWREMRDAAVRAEVNRIWPTFSTPLPKLPTLPSQETQPATEPAHDIPLQVSCLLEEVTALQAEVRDLVARLEPVMGPAMGPRVAEDQPPPPACTPLGHDIRECEGIAYLTRRAVIGALERLQLP